MLEKELKLIELPKRYSDLRKQISIILNRIWNKKWVRFPLTILLLT